MGAQASKQDKEPEKPEPDEKAKEQAAEMMTAYQDRPTLVLPGTGGAVSGTAVGAWLDEDGNSKYANDEDASAAKGESADDETTAEEQVAKDKAFNEAVLKAAKEKTSADESADEVAGSN